jgi:hypothetical protein
MRILQHVSEGAIQRVGNIPITADRITETCPEESNNLPILGNINSCKGYQRVSNRNKYRIKRLMKRTIASSCS